MTDELDPLEETTTEVELAPKAQEAPLTVSMPAVQEDIDPLEALLQGETVTYNVPGTHASIEFTRLVYEGHTVKVWVNGSNGDGPDYIIVNPPTEIINSSGQIEVNPLGAIAQAIYGAQR